MGTLKLFNHRNLLQQCFTVGKEKEKHYTKITSLFQHARLGAEAGISQWPQGVGWACPRSSSPPALAAPEKGTVDAHVCHDFNVRLQYAYTYKK